MDRVTAATVLIEAVARGSASAAAAELGMSRAMATRYIAEIEKWTGTRLLHRTTRRLSLTSGGERVLGLCQQLVAISDAIAAKAVDADGPHGTLRVAAPAIFVETRLIALLGEFTDRFPRIKIDMQIGDRTIDMVQDRIDIAIRVTATPDPALIGRKLAACPSGLYASPSYLQARTKPESPADLADHRCLTYPHMGGDEWSLATSNKKAVVNVGGGIQANDAAVLRRAAIAGLGIAILPHFAADTDVDNGDLELVLPEWQPEVLDIYALYVSRRYLPQASRAFIDFLADHL
ncbi:LysR family transcriptional regulator [Rhizobium sp. LjRoot98]|uniref:LysR family transcriptional regulator n=1 Tax=Rhizobium sp. LjRoot98 TaxID=3342345 RepID=UPI003ED05BDE